MELLLFTRAPGCCFNDWHQKTGIRHSSALTISKSPPHIHGAQTRWKRVPVRGQRHIVALETVDPGDLAPHAGYSLCLGGRYDLSVMSTPTSPSHTPPLQPRGNLNHNLYHSRDPDLSVTDILAHPHVASPNQNYILNHLHPHKVDRKRTQVFPRPLRPTQQPSQALLLRLY